MRALDTEDAPRTWPALLASRAATVGDAVALRRKALGWWHPRTWRQLNDDVVSLGNALAARGFSRSDALLVEGDPGPEALALTLAVQRLGGVANWAEEGSAAPVPDDVRFVVGNRSGPYLGERSLPARCARIGVGAHEAERWGTEGSCYTRLLAEGSEGPAPSVGAIVAEDRALRLRGRGGDDDLTHADVVSQGHAWVTEHRTGAGDRVLSPFGIGPRANAVFFGAWLAGGFCVHFGETADTRRADRREVGPSILFESAAAYADLHQHVLDGLPAAGTLQRRLIDWGLGGEAFDPVLRATADGLVRRPLRRVLGLSRVRHCLVAEGSVESATLAFYSGLGLALSAAGDRFGLESVAPLAPSSEVSPRRPRPLERIEPAEGEAS